LSAGNAEITTPNELTHVADATPRTDPMRPDICTQPIAPVIVVATHEELVRSARDMWLVAVSLLTELTPTKFTTAPWAAARFSIELPQEPLTDKDCRLADFVQFRAGASGQVHFVGMSNGSLVTPSAQVLNDHIGLADGEVQVFSMKDLENTQSLEDASSDE